MIENRRVFDPQPGWSDDRPPRRRVLLLALTALVVLVLAAGGTLAVLLLDGDADTAGSEAAGPAVTSQPALSSGPSVSSGPAVSSAAATLPRNPDGSTPLLTGPVADRLPDLQCLQFRADPPVYSCLGDGGTTVFSWTGRPDRPDNVSLYVSVQQGPERWQQVVAALAPIWGQDASDWLSALGSASQPESVDALWGDFTVLPGHPTFMTLQGHRKGSTAVTIRPVRTGITAQDVARAAQARGWTCAEEQDRTVCAKDDLQLSVQDEIGLELVIEGYRADHPDHYDLIAALPAPGPEAAEAFRRLPGYRTVTSLDGWLLYRREDRLIMTTTGWT